MLFLKKHGTKVNLPEQINKIDQKRSKKPANRWVFVHFKQKLTVINQN